MEHLWSPAGATGGNRWQMGHPRKPLKQADPQPVATHGNRFGAHGKEGVDGSSPSEGSEKTCNMQVFVVLMANAIAVAGTERVHKQDRTESAPFRAATVGHALP